MISDEQEYPELHRSIKLVPRDPRLATNPDVVRWLDELAARIQPVVDSALEAAMLDIATYGSTRGKTPEEYVLDQMNAEYMRDVLAQRVRLHERLNEILNGP